MIPSKYFNPTASTPAIRFMGIENLERYVPPKDLFLKLADTGDFLLGPMSTALFNPEIPVTDLIPALDEFAATVQKAKERPKHHEILINSRKLTLDYQGEGLVGVVYRFSDGQSDYALKIYKPHPLFKFPPSGSGGYGEMGLGLLLSNYALKDAARFHFGNAPNWGIFQWINPDDRVEDQPGSQYLQEVCQSLGLVITDKKAENYNYPGGIRYDLGSIHPKNRLMETAYSKPFYPFAKVAYLMAYHFVSWLLDIGFLKPDSQ